ncbi:MAG: hydrolase [Firmicutes bacterium]|nr:hydrolase [Bacillota bacterium]
MIKKVTAAIVVKNNKFLIAQRSPTFKVPYKWEFPGGKMEDGETPEQCLEREILEELNIKILVTNFFDQSPYDYPHGKILLLAYFATWVSGEIRLNNEHIDYCWATIDELSQYDFSPADIPIVQKLKSGFIKT